MCRPLLNMQLASSNTVVCVLLLLLQTVNGYGGTHSVAHDHFWGKGLSHPRSGPLKRKRNDFDLYDDENLQIDKYWRGIHRISREAFADLLDACKPKLQKSAVKQMNATGAVIPMIMMLSSTLAFLGGSNMWIICWKYHIASATFYNILWTTVKVINEEIAFEGLPLNDRDKLNDLSKGMNGLCGGVFEGCIGAIDGVAIKIRKPKFVMNPVHYYNRKGFFSINMQCVCDADMIITFFSLKTCGSTHDSLAFEVTGLKRKMDEGEIPDGFYLVGDDAYKNDEQMLCPYIFRKKSASR